MEIILTPDDFRADVDRNNINMSSFRFPTRQFVFHASKILFVDEKNRFHKVLKSRDGDYT